VKNINNKLECRCALCNRNISSGKGIKFVSKERKWNGRYICSKCSIKPKKLCKCGCRRIVSPGCDYINHHIFRIYSKREEVRESKRGDNNPARRIDVRKKLIEYQNSPERKLARSKFAKERNPMFKQSTKDKISKLLLGKHLSRAHKNAVSEGVRQSHIDNPNLAKAQKRRWKNKEWRENTIRRIFEASHRKPNKLEQRYIGFFNDNLLPFKYVGCGGVIINGANPDFISTNKDKQVIEIYGRHWHMSDGSKRKKRFAKVGFKCLIVWDKEIDNEYKLLSKIRRFMK